jgi:phosphohistidine swiveling domain-containing protein
VTDVEAPLFRTAIIVQDLGNPAVLNCRAATMRLHAGDWVRVNRVQGTIEILEWAAATH